MRFVYRFCRFMTACSILGVRNSLIIFSSFSDKQKKIDLFGFSFYFRGKMDKGVISHFYSTNYIIDDSNSDRKIKFIIDAGANIGDESMRFFLHNENAIIVAVEAESNNFAMLEKNFHGIQRVKCINGGIWSKSSFLKIEQASESVESFVVSETSRELASIRAFSIKELMNDYGMSEIDILKLDIEGSELELFTNNYETWIYSVNCIIMEVSDCGNQILQKLYSILSFEYDSFINGENIILIKKGIDWELKSSIGFDLNKIQGRL